MFQKEGQMDEDYKTKTTENQAWRHAAYGANLVHQHMLEGDTDLRDGMTGIRFVERV
jgi:hypothetical protein